MSGPGPRLANAFLRYSTPFSRFRNIPALGSLLQLTSSAVVGNDSLLWVQIEHGPAAGLWISLNPRTGKIVLLGEGERASSRPLLSTYALAWSFTIWAPTLASSRCLRPAGKLGNGTE